MKKDSNIEEKPLESVVDQVISKPLKKPKKKDIKNQTHTIEKANITKNKN